MNSGAGPVHSAMTAYLFASRRSLIQLRTGLTSRSVTKDQARHLVGSIEHALDEADRDLRRLPPAAGGPDTPEAGQLQGAGIRHTAAAPGTRQQDRPALRRSRRYRPCPRSQPITISRRGARHE